MKEQVLNEVKFENGRLIVPTPKGDIVVTVKDDGFRKGVYVDIESEDIKDKYAYYEDDKKPTLPLVMVEYDECDKELSTYVYGNPADEEPTHSIDHTKALMFNEDFEILPPGTKVMHNGKLGYIIKDDRDECYDGYEESLNYAIKYALEGESYTDTLERIDSSDDENSYDFMDLWIYVDEVKPLKLDVLTDELYKIENINGILDKLLDSFDEETLKKFSIDRLNKELIDVLCFSYSSILTNFIEDNKFYFNKYAYDHCLNFDKYIDKVIVSYAKISPFIDKEPTEFFNLLTEFGKDLLSRI